MNRDLKITIIKMMSKKKIFAFLLISLVVLPAFSFAFTGIGIGAAHAQYDQFRAIQAFITMDYAAGFDIGNFACIYGCISPIYQFNTGKQTAFVSIPQFCGIGLGAGVSVFNSGRFRMNIQQTFEVRNQSFFNPDVDNGYLSVLKTSVMPRYIFGKDYDSAIFCKITYAFAKDLKEWSGALGVSLEI